MGEFESKGQVGLERDELDLQKGKLDLKEQVGLRSASLIAFAKSEFDLEEMCLIPMNWGSAKNSG